MMVVWLSVTFGVGICGPLYVCVLFNSGPHSTYA